MKKILFSFPLIIWITLIFIFSNQPFEAQSIQPGLMEKISEDDLRQVVPDVTITYSGDSFNAKGEPFRFVEFTFRKAAHVFVYAVLAIFAWLALKVYVLKVRLKYLVSIGVVFVIATLDEWNQSTMATRTGAVEDVILDTFGGCLGLLGIYLASRMKKKRKKSR